MSENQLFAIFWKCVTAVLLGIAAVSGSCTMHQHRLQAEVLAKTANPALAQCSFLDEDRKSSAFCLEVARQK